MSSAYLLVSTPTWMKRLLSRSVHSNTRNQYYAVYCVTVHISEEGNKTKSKPGSVAKPAIRLKSAHGSPPSPVAQHMEYVSNND